MAQRVCTKLEQPHYLLHHTIYFIQNPEMKLMTFKVDVLANV